MQAHSVTRGKRKVRAPFSGKTNHDIATVRLATTTDGVHFTDLGAVSGLSDPTTVDYNKTRWVSPRGTLLDINGDGSLWGLYFSAGNCLDGDSDAFHYIGYAESRDMTNWTVYNDINSPIASINPITTTSTLTDPGLGAYSTQQRCSRDHRSRSRQCVLHPSSPQLETQTSTSWRPRTTVRHSSVVPVVACTVQPIAPAQMTTATNEPRILAPVRIIVPRLAQARTSVNTLRGRGRR